MNASDADNLKKWKAVIPLLYDWFANHNLTWPSLTCRWGPKLEESMYRCKYRLYFSEQTDGTDPQRITVATAEVCKPRVATAEKITGWSEMDKCPYVKVEKSIVHPGEVNKLRDCPLHPNIIVTHTDAPELYVWNIETQPHRGEKKPDPSTADLILTGHESNAEYALGMCTVEPKVASGGKDSKVLVWNLHDSITELTSNTGKVESPGGLGVKTQSGASRLDAQLHLCGHEDTVEDVVFQPGSANKLASVGDDYKLLLWDIRSGKTPVSQVAEAHGEFDLHCVDWSLRDEHLIATGCADGILKIWDERRMSPGNTVETINFHRKAIMRVEWSPHHEGILTSGGEDHVVCVWNLRQKGSEGGDAQEAKRVKRSIPQQLLFQHVGHKSVVVDLHMNPHDPWTMLSVSDDVSVDSGGGTLQMWRISDMITRPENDVLDEIASHRQYIMSGKKADATEESGGDKLVGADTKDPTAGLPVKLEYPVQHNGGASTAAAPDVGQEMEKIEVEQTAVPNPGPQFVQEYSNMAGTGIPIQTNEVPIEQPLPLAPPGTGWAANGAVRPS